LNGVKISLGCVTMTW